MNNSSGGQSEDNARNRDPITGAPGAHPVGTGGGAVAGGVTGAVAGAVGGPLGVVAGAAIGAVAGGLLGKGVAEAFNPSEELEYWRASFPTRPYKGDVDFEMFEPAYSVALDTYRNADRPGLPFESIEPTLERDWPSNRGDSTLPWKEARHAAKDAWDRLGLRAGELRSDANDSKGEISEVLEILHDGASGFRTAADKVQDGRFREAFREYAAQREEFIRELEPMVGQRGGAASHGGSVSGAIHRGWMGLRSALGGSDTAIVNECERGEDAAIETYQKVLENADLDPGVRSVLSRQYTSVKAVHDRVRDWKHALN